MDNFNTEYTGTDVHIVGWEEKKAKAIRLGLRNGQTIDEIEEKFSRRIGGYYCTIVIGREFGGDVEEHVRAVGMVPLFNYYLPKHNVEV